MVYILAADVFHAETLTADDGGLPDGKIEKHSRHNMKDDKHDIAKDPMIHICMSSDEDTVLGVVAVMNSVWTNTRHPIMFHVLLSKPAHTILKPWLEHSPLRVLDYELKVFNETDIASTIKIHGGREELAKPMNYGRYFYAEMFPDLHGRVIHLDDDVIVQGDISELFHTEIKDDHLIAVSEDCTGISKRFTQNQNTFNKYINFNHKEIKDAKLDPTACSFNVGVYVFDADKWRAENVTQKLMTWVKLNALENIYGNEQGGGGSQPPMMIVMHQRHSDMDPMWHVRHLGSSSSNKLYSAHYIAHAKLLHWNGHFKPWTGKAQQTKIWDKYFVPDPSKKIHPVRKTGAL